MKSIELFIEENNKTYTVLIGTTNMKTIKLLKILIKMILGFI